MLAIARIYLEYIFLQNIYKDKFGCIFHCIYFVKYVVQVNPTRGRIFLLYMFYKHIVRVKSTVGRFFSRVIGVGMRRLRAVVTFFLISAKQIHIYYSISHFHRGTYLIIFPETFSSAS